MSEWDQEEDQANLDVAVIGLACRLPGAGNADEFWANLRDGVESITLFTDQELLALGVSPESLRQPNFVKAGSVLKEIDLFDARFFGYSPGEAEVLDPQHRIFLECAWESLENAGYDPGRYKGLIGVFAGMSLSTYLLFNLLANPEYTNPEETFQLMIANDKDFLSTRVSYELGLKGPSLDVQTGCSTSLVAAHLACQSLLSYQCDIALAGGVSINVPQRTGYFYQEGGISSPDGHCRAFDSRAQGTIFGSGAGVVVLKRMEDALADGDTIHAVVKGSAVNNDGSLKVGFTAPSVDGQAEVIARAQAVAGVGPESITYVEAHGTATGLGDPVEIEALTKAYRAGTQAAQFCAVGTVKTNIGHLDAAAGIAGLIKTVLALKHKQLPPSLHYRSPNPQIDFSASPFFVNDRLRSWETEGETPLRAGVSSFGVGGTNAHVILEEAPEAAVAASRRRWQVLTVSARSETALAEVSRRLAARLEESDGQNCPPLADVAYTLQAGRQAMRHRRAVVCEDAAGAARALSGLDPQRVLTSRTEGGKRSVVFMFPGGGAQYVKMCAELYSTEQTFKEQVDRCAQMLMPRLGYDIRDYLYPRPELEVEAAERLKQTSLALPALFTVEYALAKLWMSWGVQPEGMIGHSLGEYVAACLAGVFTLEDALSLVMMRGELFERLPSGAMLSVELPEAEVRRLTGGRLSLAAINGPSLCVVSGQTAAVDELARRLEEMEVEFRRLQIDVAAHSSVVDPILEPFAEFIKGITLRPPRAPYVSNVTGKWVRPEEATDPGFWVRHLRETVRFSDGLREMMRSEGRVFVEVGPGQTLSTLTKMQAGQGSTHTVLATVRHPHDRQGDGEFLAKALGRLWLAGVEIDWKSYHSHERRQRVPLPTYPFERQRYWVEPASQSADPVARRAGTGKRADIAEWFYVPSWKRTAPPSNPAGARRREAGEPPRFLVFEDEAGAGPELTRRLEEKGQEVVRVRIGGEFDRQAEGVYRINPRARADYESLLAELAAAGRMPQVCVHLWSMTADGGPRQGAEFFERAQETGFYSLLFLAQALSATEGAGPLRLWVVSNNVQRVESTDVVYPEKATLLSPCKVIPQELEGVGCHFLDAGPGAAEQILAEVMGDAQERVVAYRGTQRWAQIFEPVPLGGAEETAAPPLREGGVYLITGGLGGVGQSLAEHLARSVRAKLVLLGRRALPPRESWDYRPAGGADETGRLIEKVRRLEALGAEVMVVSADVADERQMREALATARARFGEINGVIHAAGIAGEKAVNMIPDTSPGDCEAQFRAKVHGLYTLEKVLGDAELDFCLLLSSIASVLGGLGSIAYSAANQFMDSFAAERVARGGASVWVSANWDGWLLPDESKLNASFQTSIDQYAMTPEESVEAFGRAICAPPVGQLLVSTGDLQQRLSTWVEVGRGDAPGGEAVASLHARPELETAYVPPGNEMERKVAAVWQELLGIERLGIHDNFFELGGNSLIGLKVISRLKKQLNVDIPVVALFEGPTVSALAKVIGSGADEAPSYGENRSRGEERRQRALRKRKVAEPA